MDSLAQALASGQRIASDDIARYVIALGQARDLPNASLLLRTIQTQDYDVDDYETFVHTVLQNDFADLAAGCLTMGAIRTWCDDNAFYVVNQCPEVFERWAQPNESFAGSLGQNLQDVDDGHKMSVLSGRGKTTKEQKLHAFLKQDPELWRCMSPAWVGHANSALRHAAEHLGWTMDALPDMIHQHARSNTVGKWARAFDYVHSLTVATLLWNGYDHQVVGSKRLVGMSIGAHASPVDAALARAMVLRAGCPEVLFVHQDVPGVSLAERTRLEGLVDMYLTLGCPQVLIEALMHDRLPSFEHPTESGIALPDLEGPV